LADKAESVVFDNSKIKTFVPGFNATIPFAVGIRRTLKWLDDNPKMKVVSDETNQRIENILNAYQKL